MATATAYGFKEKDTIDCVVIGGYLSKGDPSLFGKYRWFLVACYDDKNDEFQALCKVGHREGMSSEELVKQTEFFKQHIIDSPRSNYRVDPGLEPDHWFKPAQVWEIACMNLTLSPVWKVGAGLVDPKKGIHLRGLRFIRTQYGKRPEQATASPSR